MAGSKTKYNKETFPELVEGLAKQGLNDEEMAKSLGISTASFYNYQRDHIEFLEAIKRGKKPIDSKVENALLKRALGYEYEEKHTEIRIDDAGNPKPAIIKTIKKQIAPDTGAIAFWLKNRKPEEWRELKNVDHTTKGQSLLDPYDGLTLEELQLKLNEARKPIKERDTDS